MLPFLFVLDSYTETAMETLPRQRTDRGTGPGLRHVRYICNVSALFITELARPAVSVSQV